MSETPPLAFRSGIANRRGRHIVGRHHAGAMCRTVLADIQQPDYTVPLSDFSNYYAGRSPRSKNNHMHHLQNHLSTVKPPIGN